MHKIKTACVQMIGPDESMDMDMRGEVGKRANPLPVKCPHCTFPDLDRVADPYLLGKGFSSPAETSSAVRGNFLVHDRVKSILELVAPHACTFHQTAELKSKKPASWWLAVPAAKLSTIRIVHKPLPPRCSKCGEPRNAFGDDGDAMKKFDSAGVDVFKSLDWSGADLQSVVESTNRFLQTQGEPPLPWSHWGVAPPPHPEHWTRDGDRELYFSVRLEQLLKRAKVKGQLVRSGAFRDLKPSPEDAAWIEEKFKLAAAHGLVDSPKATTGKVLKPTQKWFRQFLKQNTVKQTEAVDFTAVTEQFEVTLPQDYQDFIAAVGEQSFLGVNDLDGSITTILSPARLDFENYRRGKIPDLEGEDAEVDGVMFATTNFGDCFVFDVSNKSGDYPVFWYRHEGNILELFAPNFAGCIQRFAQVN